MWIRVKIRISHKGRIIGAVMYAFIVQFAVNKPQILRFICRKPFSFSLTNCKKGNKVPPQRFIYQGLCFFRYLSF